VDVGGRRVLALVTDYGVEQDELVVPVQHLRDHGATVDVAAQQRDDKDPGQRVTPTTPIDAVDASGYDLLLLPGGSIDADTLLLDAQAVAITKAFAEAGRPIAAIRHAPWTLIEAAAVEGKRPRRLHGCSRPGARRDLRLIRRRAALRYRSSCASAGRTPRS
jgi:protease I